MHLFFLFLIDLLPSDGEQVKRWKILDIHVHMEEQEIFCEIKTLPGQVG